MRRAIILMLLIGLGVGYKSYAQQTDSLPLSPVLYSLPWDIRLKALHHDSLQKPFFIPPPSKKSLTQRLLGNNALQFRLNGTAELGFKLHNNWLNNPNLTEAQRRQKSLSVGTKIQLRAEAKLGRKLSLELGYDSEAQAEEWKRRIKLLYRGDSSELVQSVALGQVAFTPQNSLMGSTRNLFGLRATLQRGPWGLNLFASHERGLRAGATPMTAGQRVEQFSLRASDYDEGRHFFLADYFRNQYNKAMAERPQANTGIQILRVEVWVSNKKAKYDDARHILALADLGESSRLHNSQIQALGGDLALPRNEANSLYNSVGNIAQTSGLREAEESLPSALRKGQDYSPIEYARLLGPEEYVLNKQLGYISLVERLRDDEELAVAYEYSYRGKVYRVGQLRANQPNSDAPIYAKLLKSLDKNPLSPYWSYMMRNVYALAQAGGRDTRHWQLSIAYESEEAGNAVLTHIPKGKLGGKRLVDILGLDLLNTQQESQSDGVADLIEGFTFDSRYAWLYLPYVEPFATPLRQQEAEEQYIYSELYDRSQAEAKRLSRKDKYLLRGSYSTTNSPLSTSQEEQGASRQTFMGVDIRYQLSQQLSVGASAMHLREQSLGTRIMLGQEPMQNTLWGANLSWQHEAKWLDRWLSAIPTLQSKQKSRLSFVGEVAYLHTDYQRGGVYEGYSVLDDFEDSYSSIDLLKPSEWSLGSVPYSLIGTSTSKGLEAGYGRAHLSWFTIDPIFSREQLGQMPLYMRGNGSYLSSHYVREVEVQELYPERDLPANGLNYLPTLNLRYYPRERGMYNFDPGINASGALLQPKQNWASIQRSLTDTDFEAHNVEYLEFWLLDPFLEDSTERRGGELLLHLGSVSEDIIPDGHKSYEHGLLPSNSSNTGNYIENEWGKISTLPTVGFAFDTQPELRQRQDVGYNGLSSVEERVYPSYQPFLQQIRQRLSPERTSLWEADAHSPLNDPAGDDFRHYRSTEWDRQEAPILERYKYFNGVEGNSTSADGYASLSPDVEDLNQDNKLSNAERYYEYAISLQAQDLRAGQNYIIASRESEVLLRNGHKSKARWYLFRIPLTEYRTAVGNMTDMKSVQSMRMVLRGFDEIVNLRFASLRFVKGSWRQYQEDLSEPSVGASAQTKVSLGAISLEEHSSRQPINYVLPPTLGRQRTSIGGETVEANEQALSIKVDNLAKGDARAIYKLGEYDLRAYKSLQLYVHAEQLPEHHSDTKDGELSLFIRIGSDFTHNYYEYTLPLTLSQEGVYSNANPYDRLAVWPLSNVIDLNLEELPLLKARRNQQMQTNRQISLSSPYSELIPQKEHSMSVLGNPSLSRVRSMMIGIRNNSGELKSIEVWVNELRLSKPLRDNAWASQARLSLDISDVASLHLEGHHSTAGWGDIAQRFTERQRADVSQIQVRGQADLGRFLGDKLRTTIPIQYQYARLSTTPEYKPLDDDIRLGDIQKSGLSSKEQSFVLGLSRAGSTSETFNLSGLNVGIKSKTPMPYDPANLHLDYTYHYDAEYSPSIAYHNKLNWQLGLHYDYSTAFKPLLPFRRLSGNGVFKDFLRAYRLKLWPDKVSLQSLLSRQYEEEQQQSYLAEETLGSIKPSFSQLFVWQRKFNLSWTLIPELKLNLSTATDARIEAPHIQVNKRLNPDDYALWKEAVYRSIADLGSPQEYRQQASLIYTLPSAQIAPLSWLSATLSYTSNYEWERGALLRVQMPHTISSQRNIDYALQMNMRRLYSLIPKLKALNEGNSPFLALREISLSYRNGRSLYLPGYTELIGDMFGQRNTEGGLHPGLDFAFGFADEHYIRRAVEHHWLNSDASLALSGIYTESKTFDIKLLLQPIKGLNITLLGNHNLNHRQEQQYHNLDMPLLGGDVQMTTIGLRGIWASSSANTSSPVFNQFLAERDAVYQSWLSTLPSGTDPSMLSLNSPAVLIPAFRKTYTAGIGSSSLQALPRSLWSLLPNWNVEYHIGNKFPLIGKYLRHIQLRHAYRGIYRVHSYDTFTDWQAVGHSSLGLRSGSGLLSLAEDISTISLSEQLYPLLGIDIGLNNGLSLIGQWRKSRTLSLGLSAERMIESMSNEWNIGLSYQIADMRSLWKPRAKRANTDARGLTLKVDYSHSQNHSLIRLLNKAFTQTTLGSEQERISMSIDYELSRALSLRAFYEWQYIRPLVSSTAFPTLLRSYGLSLKLNLQQ